MQPTHAFVCSNCCAPRQLLTTLNTCSSFPGQCYRPPMGIPYTAKFVLVFSIICHTDQPKKREHSGLQYSDHSYTYSGYKHQNTRLFRCLCFVLITSESRILCSLELPHLKPPELQWKLHHNMPVLEQATDYKCRFQENIFLLISESHWQIRLSNIRNKTRNSVSCIFLEQV